MSIENLLKPRFKVIANYPYSPHRIGKILETNSIDAFHMTTTSYQDEYGMKIDCANLVSSKTIETYPHLFKKLEWYEERKPEEMPLYVKSKHGKVIKLSGYGHVGTNGEGPLHLGWVDEKKGMQTRNARLFMPATEEEYNESITPKQKQPDR